MKLFEKDSNQPAHTQAAYLKEFCFIFQQAPSHQLLSLALPRVDDTSIKVSILDSSSSSTHTILHGEEDIWQKLESELVQDGFNRKAPPTKHLAIRNVAIREGGKTICAVGEPLFVLMEVRNPLQIEIIVGEVFLECAYYPQIQMIPTQPTLPTEWTIHGTITPGRISYEQWEVEKIPEVTLQPNEKRKVRYGTAF